MADTNMLTLSRPGQVNKAGDPAALFIKMFSGEVFTAFEENNIMKELHRMRQIEHGKAATFPVLGKGMARYHEIGTPITGSNRIATNERTINIDDLLIADVALYDLEDAMNHYDVRGEYSKQMGRALAKAFDEKTLRVGVLAARDPGLIEDDPAGSVIKGGDTLATDGEKLAEAIWACAQTWDERDITEDDRSIILRPAQYYLLNQTTKVLNRDWMGSGSYADGKLDKLAGLSVRMSNHLPKTDITGPTAGEKNVYHGDFTKTVGLALQRDAIGTVLLRDLTVQQSGEDFSIMYQAVLVLAKYAMGHGILRPGCAIELSSAVA